MQQDVPVFIIEPVALFREGLRRILSEARFQAVWCSDRSPLGPIPSLNDKVSPLVIVGHEVDEALITIAEVQRYYPTSLVVLLVDRFAGSEIVVALQAGATMVLDRASSCESLIGALKLIMNGATVLPSDLLRSLLTDRALPAPKGLQLSRESPPEGPTQLLGRVAPWGELGSSEVHPLAPEPAHLSKREFAVLEHLQRGLSNKEIASRLDIADATVKVHVKAILRKARLRNRIRLQCGHPGTDQIRLEFVPPRLCVDLFDGGSCSRVDLVRAGRPRAVLQIRPAHEWTALIAAPPCRFPALAVRSVAHKPLKGRYFFVDCPLISR